MLKNDKLFKEKEILKNVNCSSNTQSINLPEVCDNKINCFDKSDEICNHKNSLSKKFVSCKK